MLWFAIFMLLPLVSMLYLSMTDWGGLLSQSQFVGFNTYRKVFSDPVFWASVRNTLIQVGIAVPTMMILGFMLAYYLSLKPRGRNLLRVLFFTPALLSMSAKSVMFLIVLAPEGLINGLLSTVGLDSLATSWLANPKTALGTLIAIDIWSGIGFTAVLLCARMSGLPSEVMEAATLDGAGHWQTMWRIAFPMTLDYFGALATLQFLWTTFGSAGIVYLLTSGGPGTSTTTLSYLVFSRAFYQQGIGYSQVVGVFLFTFGVAGIWAIRRATKSRV